MGSVAYGAEGAAPSLQKGCYMKKKRLRMDTARRRKWRTVFIVIAVCLAVIVIANMLMIYMFSEESREESGKRGTGIGALFLKILHPDFENYAYKDQVRVQQEVKHLIRKLAHFTEFALLGFFSADLILHVNRRKHWIKKWLEWVIPVVFCLLYAVSDEVHQIFSDRGPRVTDVLIDFGGALCGICAAHLLFGLIFRKKDKRKKALCETRDTN